MLLNAVLLVQDVQLACFTVVFGVLALQKWSDLPRRWLWFSFLANAAGCGLDLLGPHVPAWLGHGFNGLTIPLSYALLNVSLVYFDRRGKRSVWISALILLAGLPVLLAWRNAPVRVQSDAFGDLLIALECIVTTVLLSAHDEKATRPPRLLMGVFLAYFVVMELARVFVVFVLHGDPDVTTPRLATVCVVTYVTNVSLLPLAYIWMMQSRMEWSLFQQSIVDPLTGVLNRRGLEHALERELGRHRRYGYDLTLAIFDLDHFKGMNDRFGHASGDAILVGVARFMAGQLRGCDVIGRYGGEEFVMLFPYAELQDAKPVLERLCSSLAEYGGLLPGAGLSVTASFGVTSVGGRRAVDATELLAEADFALYRAKGNGRNQVCYFESPGSPVAQRDKDIAAPQPETSSWSAPAQLPQNLLIKQIPYRIDQSHRPVSR
ncbi:GGDEF domain-containing protein [Silvibacterium acidisoli]|uniref:GGDEF domain-containing protein n=1 Tax=Acidobacteriaceae bacterium ZG23-2 TaxID=2883246 RepID=UPI00406BE6D9